MSEQTKLHPDGALTPEAWRGKCLNLYARAERAVGLAVEEAHRTGTTSKLRHLAGQRLADLIEVVDKRDATNKQIKAFANALDAWKVVDSRRQFLAHGVASVSKDTRGKWTLLLDIVVYRQNVPYPERWAVKECEAAEFLTKLEDGFKMLSGQLGHFRKSLSD